CRHDEAFEPEMRMRWLFAWVALLVAAGLAPLASAQTGTQWPTKPVKLLIPFTAGGTADTLGRLAAQKLSGALGQQFVPENKPGASGLIAAAETVNAPPDGYTLFVSGVGGLIIASAITPNPPPPVISGYTPIVHFRGAPAGVLVDQ